jgi:hypothetical protein
MRITQQSILMNKMYVSQKKKSISKQHNEPLNCLYLTDDKREKKAELFRKNCRVNDVDFFLKYMSKSGENAERKSKRKFGRKN